MIQKKIFVLSDEDDGTTDEVLDWLSYYNYPFLRLNRTSEIHVKSIYIYDYHGDVTPTCIYFDSYLV